MLVLVLSNNKAARLNLIWRTKALGERPETSLIFLYRPEWLIPIFLVNSFMEKLSLSISLSIISMHRSRNWRCSAETFTVFFLSVTVSRKYCCNVFLLLRILATLAIKNAASRGFMI